MGSVDIYICLHLTPLSTTALFTAAGMARVNPWHILPPFFCGRLITDVVMVYTGKYAAGNVSGLLHGQLSIKSVLTLIAGLLIIGAFLFINWRCLLEKRKLRVNFKILPEPRELSGFYPVRAVLLFPVQAGPRLVSRW